MWTIRLKPGERIGFHRHVLNYFWTSVNGGRGRQHLMDGTTVEYTYYPGETRHETYGAGEFKVHDLENLGDQDMIFMTVEFDRGLGQQAAAGAGDRAAEGGVVARPFAFAPSPLVGEGCSISQQQASGEGYPSPVLLR